MVAVIVWRNTRISGLAFFELKSLLGIARQWSSEKIAILTFQRSHVRILYTALSRKVVGKSTREQSRKVLWVVLSSLFFKQI